MIRVIILLSAFIISPSYAQQSISPSPEIQAMQARIMQELNSNLQCSIMLIRLRETNEALKAEVERLMKLVGGPRSEGSTPPGE